MPTILTLIRHGECQEYNSGEPRSPGPGLNRHGKKQAKKTRDYLKNYQYDVIITSEMARAKETAEIINKPHKKEITTSEEINALQEKNFVTNKALSEYDDAIFDECSSGDAEKKQYEEILGFAKKANKALDELIDKYSGKKIVVVGHGNVMRAYIGKLLGFSIENSPDINFFFCSVFTFILEKGKVRGIYHFNSVDHYMRPNFEARFDRNILY